MISKVKDVMKVKKYKKSFVDWLLLFPKLLLEILLFVLNIPKFCYLFLLGFRTTIDSYSKLIDGLSTIQKSIEHLFETKLNEQQVATVFRKLLKETQRLNLEQEKSFSALFSIFIAILALFISIIALLFRR